jgi:hypothetical protein
LGAGWRGLRFVPAGVAAHGLDVAAGCGAREEDTLEGGGAEEAALEVGHDGGEVGGAEGRGDEGEGRGGGTAVEGVEQMASVAKELADGVEHEGEVAAGPGVLGTSCYVFVCITHKMVGNARIICGRVVDGKSNPSVRDDICHA